MGARWSGRDYQHANALCHSLTSTAQVGWHIASAGEAALAITTLILRVGPRAHEMTCAKEADGGADWP